MVDTQLVLSVPQGAITATSLGIDGLARHYSPGSGKHFKGRKLFIELKTKDNQPDFKYLNEGDWRDADKDSVQALTAAANGKRTKTALSNNAFSCTPTMAYKQIYLVKTGGKVLELEQKQLLHSFAPGDCHEGMLPAEVAEAAGSPAQTTRTSHIYLVMSPIQLLIVSNLTPIEYAWYATHRPGKVFRQVLFTEVLPEQPLLAAQSRFIDAQQEINIHPDKKTKTIVSGDCLNKVQFHTWLGYEDSAKGGLYVANQEKICVWRFPETIPVAWKRARG